MAAWRAGPLAAAVMTACSQRRADVAGPEAAVTASGVGDGTTAKQAGPVATAVVAGGSSTARVAELAAAGVVGGATARQAGPAPTGSGSVCRADMATAAGAKLTGAPSACCAAAS